MMKTGGRNTTKKVVFSPSAKREVGGDLTSRTFCLNCWLAPSRQSWAVRHTEIGLGLSLGHSRRARRKGEIKTTLYHLLGQIKRVFVPPSTSLSLLATPAISYVNRSTAERAFINGLSRRPAPLTVKSFIESTGTLIRIAFLIGWQKVVRFLEQNKYLTNKGEKSLNT